MKSILTKLTPPEGGKGEIAYKAVETALSLLPAVSGVFNMVLRSPLERRRSEWEEDVCEAISKLAATQGCSPEQMAEHLSADERFVDCLVKATLIRLRTSQDEKKEALKCTLLNSVGVTAPEHALQQIFLGLLDELTVWHLRLLLLFQKPETELGRLGFDRSKISHNGSTFDVIKQVYPELQKRRDFCEFIWDDLKRRGLTERSELSSQLTFIGEFPKRTSVLGDQFIEFITSEV